MSLVRRLIDRFGRASAAAAVVTVALALACAATPLAALGATAETGWRVLLGECPVSGQSRSPHGIAVDTDGNVYVADTGNNRIQVLPAAARAGG